MALFLLGSSSVCEAPAFNMVSFFICDFIIPRLKHTQMQSAGVLQDMERPLESLYIFRGRSCFGGSKLAFAVWAFFPSYISANQYWNVLIEPVMYFAYVTTKICLK
jgi:hypothetical protein